tara:strand:+ start:3607 stop:5658 length:2052 start_codon:yes stop_codon:yes gene_type:complete
MRLILDVENSVTWRDGKIFNDPFEPENTLTQIGVVNADNHEELQIVTLDHDEAKDEDGLGKAFIQSLLDKTELLIMHNANHDLMWLWECGYKYDGAIWDTMLAEYILHRGVEKPLSLAAVAEERNLSEQKEDYLGKCIKQGINTNETDLHSLSVYLRADLLTTSELFHSQERDFQTSEATSLYRVRDITFETCRTLTHLRMHGFRVNVQELQRVREDYENEKAEIEERLQEKVRELMGDTPINIGSPEQKSQVIFSRKPHDKRDWQGLFEFTSTTKEFKDAVRLNSSTVYRTKAYQCETCKGSGKTYKVRKNGERYAKPNKCKDCDARGFKLMETKQVAGLRFTAPSKEWASANGFSTSKKHLEKLLVTAKNNNMADAINFLTDLMRHAAVSSYLSSFVNGIDTHRKPTTSYLHVQLTQSITHTGRFSGRNPNMQNMPRGGTFPIKRVFVSRWDTGKIIEADFAQLEFRTAAFLAQDKTAMEEIATGFDVHSYTAKVISDAGQPTTRQEAKEHTFAPLFGATGYGRTKAEATYYSHFIKKYKGIAAWHKKLGEEAIRFMKITNISGRQYAFPDVKRRDNGMPSHFTMIKNYPVQGFATGDVVPVVLNEMHKRLQPFSSCLVNTVHDSMVIDVHPDEEQEVLQMINDMNNDLNDLIKDAYDIEMNVPLLLEAKIGTNWLDTVDV